MMKQVQKDVLKWWKNKRIDEKQKLSDKHHKKIYHQISYMEIKRIWQKEQLPTSTSFIKCTKCGSEYNTKFMSKCLCGG